MYRIKNFGLLNKEKQLEVLDCFRYNDDDDILFQYYQNTLLTVEYIKNNINDELIDEIEEYFNDFCMDLFYYESQLEKENLENKIKAILFESIYKNYNYSNNEEIEKIKENLFNELKNNNLLNISNKTLQTIKYLIFVEINNNSIDQKAQEFVTNRKIFCNNTYICSDGVKDINHKIIWYKPINKEEYLYSMDLSLFYSGIVVNNKLDFKDYSYAFLYEETSDDYDLIIFTNKSVDFDQMIFKKIIYKDNELSTRILKI